MRQRRKNRRRAQARGTTDFIDVQTVVGFEPDPVMIDDADNRNRNVEPPRGNGRDAVECAVVLQREMAERILDAVRERLR